MRTAVRRSLHRHDAAVCGIEVEPDIRARAVCIAIRVVEPAVEAKAIHVTIHAHGCRRRKRELEFIVIDNLGVVRGHHEAARCILRQWRPCGRTITKFREHASRSAHWLRHGILENAAVDGWRGLTRRYGECGRELQIAEVGLAGHTCFVEHARVGKAVWQGKRARSDRRHVCRGNADASHRSSICWGTARHLSRADVCARRRHICTNGERHATGQIRVRHGDSRRRGIRETIVWRDGRDCEIDEVIGSTWRRGWISVEIREIAVCIRAGNVARQARVYWWKERHRRLVHSETVSRHVRREVRPRWRMTNRIEQHVACRDELDGVTSAIFVIEVVEDYVRRRKSRHLCRPRRPEFVRGKQNTIDRNSNSGGNSHFRAIRAARRCRRPLDIIQLHARNETAAGTSDFDKGFPIIAGRWINERFIDDCHFATSIRRTFGVRHLCANARRRIEARAPIRSAVIACSREQRWLDLCADVGETRKCRRRHRRRRIGMEGREINGVLQGETLRAIHRNHIARIPQRHARARCTNYERGTGRNAGCARRIHDAPCIPIGWNRHRCGAGIRRIRCCANRKRKARSRTNDVTTDINGRRRRVVKLDEFGPERREFRNDDVSSLVRRNGGHAPGQIADV